MILVFMRHGQKLGRGDAATLTDQGREQAATAGRWLEEAGLRPTHVIHTHRARTRETAELAVGAVGLDLAALPTTVRRGIPNASKWEAFVADLAQEHPADAVILLVGHHPTDAMVRNLYGLGKAPTFPKERLTAVLELGPNGWRCTRHTALVDA